MNIFSFLHKPNNPFITFYVQYAQENYFPRENLDNNTEIADILKAFARNPGRI